jgi:hypothetical protein
VYNPGIADRNNLATRHKKEKGTFYGYTAAGLMALEEKDQCKLTSNYKDLKGRAEIESGKEGKRSPLRSAKEQVEALCCSEPEAHNKTKAFLKPYDARIFSEGRPGTFAINGFACSGRAKGTTKEVLSNVVRSKQKGPFTSTDGKLREFTPVVLKSTWSLWSRNMRRTLQMGRSSWTDVATRSLPAYSTACRPKSYLNRNRGEGVQGKLPRQFGTAGGRRGSPAARRRK